MRNRYLLVSDVVAFALSGALAYTARFEGFEWMPGETASLTAFLSLAVPVRVLVNVTLGLYQRVWSLASIAELERIFAAVIVSGLLTVLVGLIAVPELGMASHPVPVGVLLLDAFFAASGVALPRIALRFRERRLIRRASRGKEYRDLPGALVLGAGAAGQIVARELTTKAGGNALANVFVMAHRTDTHEYGGYEVTSRLDGSYDVPTIHSTAQHYLVAYLPGSPDRAGTTVDTLVPANIDGT